jgi:hypothetical protein
MVRNRKLTKSSPSENKYCIQPNPHVEMLRPIQDWIGSKRCNLIRNPSKFSITSYFNNMKPAKHIHLVYLVHFVPNFTHFTIDEMSDCCKANLPAVRHKEDMPIDQENININADLLLEL